MRIGTAFDGSKHDVVPCGYRCRLDKSQVDSRRAMAAHFCAERSAVPPELVSCSGLSAAEMKEPSAIQVNFPSSYGRGQNTVACMPERDVKVWIFEGRSIASHSHA